MEKGRRMFSVGRTLIYPEFIFSFNMCLKNTFIEPVISDIVIKNTIMTSGC